MKKLLPFLLLFFALPASAANIYVAAASAGANNGSSCANARIYTSLVSGDYVPDNFIHLCGTITSATGVTALTVQGSGTSGHPITIVFETGAILTAPYWPLIGGALNLNSQSFITVDGGTNGLITASANGDGLTFSLNTKGIEAQGATNAIIKNLNITNLFVEIEGGTTSRTCPDGVAPAAGGYTVMGIHLGASNQLATNNVLDHIRYGIYGIYTSSATSNIEISNNTFTFTESTIIVGDGQSNSVLSGLKIHDNDFGGGNYLWDSDNTTSNCFHHNGIHLWATQPGSLFTGIQIYNNNFHGIMGRDSAWASVNGGGSHISGVIFLETVGDNSLTFNNTISLTGTLNHPGNGYIYCKSSGTPAESCRNASFYNNTILTTSGGNCAELDSTGALWKNNICSGESTAIYPPNNGSPGNYLNTVTADYDDYYPATMSFGVFDTWSGWRTKGEDPNGIQTNPNLNASTFVPNTGSPVINTGVNLTSLGIAALNADKNGSARPGGVTRWTMGALNASTGGAPATPTNISIVVVGP